MRFIPIPIAFTLERRSIFPILTVTGIAQQPVPDIDRVMLNKAVEIIEKAEKFKGKVLSPNGVENMSDIPRGMVAVRFHIIFKDDEELEACRSGIKRELG